MVILKQEILTDILRNFNDHGNRINILFEHSGRILLEILGQCIQASFQNTAFASFYDWLRKFGHHLLSIIWKLISVKFEFLIWENFKIIMKLMSKTPKIKFTSILMVQMEKIVRSGRFLLYQGFTDESGRHLTWKPWKFWIPWHIRCQLSCSPRHISQRSDCTRKRNEFSR